MTQTFTIDRGQGPEALEFGPFVDGDGIQHSVQVLELWGDESLAAIGVVRSEGPAPVPAAVARVWCLLALHGAGLKAAVDAAVAAADETTQIIYTAETWRRADPTLLALSGGLGLTGEDLDNLFRSAEALRLAAGG